MAGTFACPECGNPLELKGLSPGRQVRCGWCRSWVEVPFLPRALPRRSSRSARRVRDWPRWTWGVLALSAVILLLAGTTRRQKERSREARAKELDRLSAEAEGEEKAGHLGPALAAVEAALAESSKCAPGDDARRVRLEGWRDRLAAREFEARLAEVAGLPPGRAVGACLSLRARARRSPALARFEGAIDDQIDRARERWVVADLADARRALDAGDASAVLDRCERLVENANALTSDTRRRAREEADALVARVVGERGVVVGAARGRYVLGSDASYGRLLQPLLSDNLRRRGYLPRPDSSFWSPLWDATAPFRLEVAVAESFPGTYEESKNRISAIDVTITLRQKGTDRLAWQAEVKSQTRIPLPKLPAYLGGRLATSAHRAPDIERLLYDDAHSQLAERLGRQLRALPESRTALAPPAPAPTPTASANRS